MSRSPARVAPRLTKAEVEAGCRALHKCQGTGSPDAPLHHPAQNSWDVPTMVRWQQWEETVRAVHKAMRKAAAKERA